jgi:hypothetical protein
VPGNFDTLPVRQHPIDDREFRPQLQAARDAVGDVAKITDEHDRRIILQHGGKQMPHEGVILNQDDARGFHRQRL